MRIDWQPIESAPMDGTKVLLCQARNSDGHPIQGDSWGLFVQVAAWWEGDDAWIVYCSQVQEPQLHFVPTHWAELPDNPVTPSAAAGGKE